MNSMKRQKDRTLKDELPRLVSQFSRSVVSNFRGGLNKTVGEKKWHFELVLKSRQVQYKLMVAKGPSLAIPLGPAFTLKFPTSPT